MKNIIKIILIICLFNMLSACGRYSEPSPVPGSGYPHTYPNPQE